MLYLSYEKDMKKSRINKEKQKRLIEYFVAGVIAHTASELVGVHRNTAIYYFHRIRELIYNYQKENTMFTGEVEVDESYFGVVHKGKRGRVAGGKTTCTRNNVNRLKLYL